MRQLQLQVGNAEAELHRTQKEDDSIRQSQADETRRLWELEILLQAQEQYLVQREEEIILWSQEYRDYLKSMEANLDHRLSDMKRAREGHKNISQQVQAREIAVGKAQEEQEKMSLERANLKTQLTHAQQLCMAKDGEIENLLTMFYRFR